MEALLVWLVRGKKSLTTLVFQYHNKKAYLRSSYKIFCEKLRTLIYLLQTILVPLTEYLTFFQALNNSILPDALDKNNTEI